MDLTASDLQAGFDDWYEQALKSGGGFKTDDERAAYIAAIGDPMKHPMFATKSEDLIGNPLADALRAIREEDKTRIGVATLYKEDGNELLMKAKGSSEKLHEAADAYTHSLSTLDQAFEARENGTEDEADKEVDINNMRSQVLSNRALVWLTLKNYRTCINDCNISLSFWRQNAKGHYRKCKALFELKRYVECMCACDEAVSCLSTPPSPPSAAANTGADSAVPAASAAAVSPPAAAPAAASTGSCGLTQIIELKGKSVEEIRKKQELEAAKRRQHAARIEEWTALWNHVVRRNKQLAKRGPKVKPVTSAYPSTLGDSISLGFCTDVFPSQLQDIYPVIEDDTRVLCVPMLLLYPQYNQLDVIHAAKSDALLAEYLAEMFPEFEDGGQPVEWDVRREYQLSSLVAYCPIYQTQRVNSADEWTAACLERRQVAGSEGSGEADSAKAAIADRTKDRTTIVQSFLSNGGPQPAAAASPAVEALLHMRAGFVEVHLGCSIEQALRVPGCAVPGGVLNLLVFVKGSQSDLDFISSSKKQGLQMHKLQPTEAIAPLK